MSKWRLIEVDLPSYADMSIRLRPALTRAVDERLITNTVVLCRTSQRCLQIQYYNDPYKDIDLAAAREMGIVVKRGGLSGGGPIYADPGLFLFGLFIERGDPSIPRVDELALARLLQTLADRVGNYYGLPMRYRPLNDGEYWEPTTKSWKKVFPSSVTGLERAIQLMGGIQECKPETEIAAKVITPPPEKFLDKKARSVADRVGSLEEAIGEPPVHEDVKRLVIEAIEGAYGVEMVPDVFGDEEKEYMEKAAAEFDNEAWLLARSEEKFGVVDPTVTKGEAVAKPPSGPLLRVTVLCEAGRIKDLLITGGLHVSPIDALVRLEEEMKGVPVQERALKEKVEGFFARTGALTPMLTPEVIGETMFRAAQGAMGW